MWRLYSNVPLNAEGKRKIKMATEVSNKVLESIDNSMPKPPQLARCHKIDTIQQREQKEVYWTNHNFSIGKAPQIQHKWAARLASKELPTCLVTETNMDIYHI